jgi:polynucleotide 5'-kinase involved in rRNA processing
MPDYSGLARERDVYGELGWIPNFNVKLSKNNDHRHNNYREYFDAPRDYNVAFTNATVTNTEFFRENAPGASVAKGDMSKSLL